VTLRPCFASLLYAGWLLGEVREPASSHPPTRLPAYAALRCVGTWAAALRADLGVVLRQGGLGRSVAAGGTWAVLGTLATAMWVA